MDTTGAQSSGASQTLGAAVRLIVATPILLATTLMFMLVNIGEGIVAVLTPVYAREVLSGGPGTYGALVSVSAAAGLLGALAAGASAGRVPLGRAIAISEIVSGCAALAAKPALAFTFVFLAAGSLLLGPLTV